MKKFLVLLLAASLLALFAACGDNAPEGPAADTETPAQEIASTYELAMITDGNDIEFSDNFIRESWSGLKKYADENDISYTCYVPLDVSDQAYADAVAKAVNNGAKLVILPSGLFEVAAYEVQYKYPDVSFVILDGEPRTSDYKDYTIEKNVNAIYFAEQELGFLAGYAAVKEGFTQLGFIGGMALDPVVRFGYGYIAGAKYAAAENDVSGLEIKYTYSGGFAASEEVQKLASGWYNSGTNVIFACGGAITESVSAAAETAGAYVIGVDTDESGLSSTIITSAKKEVAGAVYGSIEDYYNGEFHGGVIDTLTAASGGVSLEIANSRFTKFTSKNYDAILAKLTSGSISLPDKDAVSSAAALGDGRVKVTLVN